MTNLLEFLKQSIYYQIELSFQQKESAEKPALNLIKNASNHTIIDLIEKNNLDERDIQLLLLALAPAIRSGFLENIIREFVQNEKDFADLGCVKLRDQNTLLPTFETALFLLAGSDVDNRIQAMAYIQKDSLLFKKGILYFQETDQHEPMLSRKLFLDEEYLDLFTTGEVRKPKPGVNFPAHIIHTPLEWENLILQAKTLLQIKEIQHWLEHEDLILNTWNMKNKIKPGYRVLFHGLPGTGKTLTAGLLGKYTGRDVYRIDLSRVVSKYIGETEKNLAKLFDKAENKNWILFFDEADSIFGKRTGVKDAHDKYANQEVSYLLQKIESHAGLVILASNFKSNIDKAFVRRFQSVIEFEKPTPAERLLLWQDILPKEVILEEEISLENLSQNYNLTGANIVNVVQYACLKTASSGKNSISLDHLVEGIKREFSKEERMI